LEWFCMWPDEGPREKLYLVCYPDLMQGLIDFPMARR
jgi:hypothetical protein